jgi:septum formation protein
VDPVDGLPDVYLASASPRRRELLDQLGISHRRLSVCVDESVRPGEAAGDYVARVALAKARAGWVALAGQAVRPVLAADTAVVVDGDILGKPRDRAHGLTMLRRLSARRHAVVTGVALCWAQREAVRVQESAVHFRELGAGEPERYWATDEPLDKAGGYAIQGRGAVFVARLEGSYSGVMGLPLYETWELLLEAGIEVTPGPITGPGQERG